MKLKSHHLTNHQAMPSSPCASHLLNTYYISSHTSQSRAEQQWERTPMTATTTTTTLEMELIFFVQTVALSCQVSVEQIRSVQSASQPALCGDSPPRFVRGSSVDTV